MKSDQKALYSLLSGTSSVTLPMLSGSMAPLIVPGEKVTIHSINGKRIKSGDIAVFYKDGKFTAHRILLKFPGRHSFVLEKGDSNAFGSILSGKRIVGRIIKIEKSDIILNLDEKKTGIRFRIEAKIKLFRYLFLDLWISLIKGLLKHVFL